MCSLSFSLSMHRGHPVKVLILRTMHLSSRAGPRGVVYGGGGGGGGGALQVGRVRKPLLIGGGSGGAPPGNFLKSMSLIMHFRSF